MAERVLFPWSYFLHHYIRSAAQNNHDRLSISLILAGLLGSFYGVFDPVLEGGQSVCPY